MREVRADLKISVPCHRRRLSLFIHFTLPTCLIGSVCREICYSINIQYRVCCDVWCVFPQDIHLISGLSLRFFVFDLFSVFYFLNSFIILERLHIQSKTHTLLQCACMLLHAYLFMSKCEESPFQKQRKDWKKSVFEKWLNRKEHTRTHMHMHAWTHTHTHTHTHTLHSSLSYLHHSLKSIYWNWDCWRRMAQRPPLRA